MAAVRAVDYIVPSQGGANTDRRGLLANGKVHRTLHLLLWIELTNLLFGASNQKHYPQKIHVEFFGKAPHGRANSSFLIAWTPLPSSTSRRTSRGPDRGTIGIRFLSFNQYRLDCPADGLVRGELCPPAQGSQLLSP